MTNWREIRNHFPITESIVYLNSAAAGPLSRQVEEAGTGFFREMSETGDHNWNEWIDRRERVREQIAKLINAYPDEIGFTQNTSSGMNLIVDALSAIYDTGEVISCNLEFPVSTIPWMHRGFKVHLTETPMGVLHADQLLESRTDKTRIISLSHVQYSNGFRSDLYEVGRNKGDLHFVVNASQSLGAFEIDVKKMSIDALCTTGHKWMMAGYGTGFVYISRELLKRTKPRAIGWLSVEKPFRMINSSFTVREEMAARSELGCPSFAGIFSIGAAVEYILNIGPANIERRVLAINQYLAEKLLEYNFKVLSPLSNEAYRSAETLVEISDQRNLVSYLRQNRIAVTEKPEGIRVATHLFNDETDVDKLVDALHAWRSGVQ
jgi:cysteine desulfurase / selenocysteine lyase